jgi:hypothetical protein
MDGEDAVMGFRGFNPETLAELDAIQKQIDALNRQSDSDWSGFTGEVLNVPNATYWDNGRAPTLDGGTAERTPVHPTAGGSSILPRSSTNAEMVRQLERDREAIYQADYDLSRQYRGY